MYRFQVIDYAELCSALEAWRTRQGLPVGSGLPTLTPPPRAAASVTAPPPPRPSAPRAAVAAPVHTPSARPATAELLDADAFDEVAEEAADEALDEAAQAADADAGTYGEADDYRDEATMLGEAPRAPALAAHPDDDQGGLVEPVAFAPFGAEATAIGDGGFDRPSHTKLGHTPAAPGRGAMVMDPGIDDDADRS